MKKMLAILLAVSMIMGLAISASADTGSVDCTSGWWQNHSEGIAVTADGVTVTFDSVSNLDADGAFQNWYCPVVIVYSSDDGSVTNADWKGYTAPNYVEYWVQRVDNWGWGGAGFDWVNTLGDLASYGITYSCTWGDTAWDNLWTALQGGVSGTITAKLEGSNAVVTFSCADITSTVSIPVDTSKTVYVSLSGQCCSISNIVATSNKVEEPTTEPETAAPEYKEVTAPETGVAFKLATVQENLETTLYFAGTTANQDYYLATTEVVTEATDVYLEAVEGGYRMYFDAEGVKTYIDIYENGTYINLRLTTEPTAVYTWNTEYNTLVAVIGETEYYMGTYKTYNTLSASKLSYISTSFPCKLYQEVKVVADGSNAKTGDSISVFVALMAVSAMGIAIVSKKRF